MEDKIYEALCQLYGYLYGKWFPRNEMHVGSKTAKVMRRIAKEVANDK